MSFLSVYEIFNRTSTYSGSVIRQYYAILNVTATVALRFNRSEGLPPGSLSRSQQNSAVALGKVSDLITMKIHSCTTDDLSQSRLESITGSQIKI